MDDVRCRKAKFYRAEKARKWVHRYIKLKSKQAGFSEGVMDC